MKVLPSNKVVVDLIIEAQSTSSIEASSGLGVHCSVKCHDINETVLINP